MLKKLHSIRIITLMVFVFLISIHQHSFAQFGQFVNGANLYSPPSPNASALLRYANSPVDEHTGIPSVILPLDKLSGRQLSVPVTLSYHASGIKVQDIASNVGLGFVLNAGGVITRVMRGLPDENPSGYQYSGRRITSSSTDSTYFNATINNKIDAEPDMFYFNFLGNNGKMVIDTLGNAQYLPDQGIRVLSHPIHNNPDSVHNGWVLKDLMGTTYVFGKDSSSQEITTVNMADLPATKSITYTSSWYLSKIITPDGKETINFQYNTGPPLSYSQSRNLTTYNIHYDITDKRKSLFGGGVDHHEDLSAENVVKTDVSTLIQVQNPKYLSKISNDMGWLSFSYNPRQDLNGGLALYQVKLFNINDSATPIKTYTLSQSYFISPHPNSDTDPDSKRLKLDCVYLGGRSAETKQLFVLTYNNQTLLPPRNSDEFDHWGYYTTLDKRAGFPPVNLTLDKTGNYDDGFEERAPDSVRLKACMLMKVRNVNGGYTNFSYEINDYQLDGTTHFGGGLRIKTISETDSLGQVVPIVKQYVYTNEDSTSSGTIYNAKPYYIQGITNYQTDIVVPAIPSLLSYIGSHTNTSAIISILADATLFALHAASGAGLIIDVAIYVIVPALVDAYQFIFHRTHHSTYDSPPFTLSSTPLNNLFDINGSSVSYSRVSIINPDGGRIVNYYTSSQDYPDSTSSARLNILAQPIKATYGNAGSYAPVTSFDFERGLLKQSKAYDNNNNLVSSIENTYQLSRRVATVLGQRPSVSGYATRSDGSFQVITYDVGVYKEVAQNIQLVQTVVKLYDQSNNGTSLTSTHNYSWATGYPTLIHSESTPRSDGKLLVNYYTYPFDYSQSNAYLNQSYVPDFLGDMMSHSIVGSPIEKVSTLQDQGNVLIIGGLISKFKPGGLGLLDTIFSLRASKPIPLANFKFSNLVAGNLNGQVQPFSKDSNYVAKSFYQLYDSKDNLIQSQNVGEPANSVIWGYNQDLPIAQISNATADRVAYTSFETNEQQYWTFASAGRDSVTLAKTGKVRYQLDKGTIATTNILPAGTYIISVWSQGPKPTINGVNSDQVVVNGESDTNEWNFFMDQVTLNAGSRISLSGSGLIDELRLYPQGAHITTMTASDQVGTTSVNSKDDKSSTLEYDALQRVKTERDDQYNIIKDYTYANIDPVPCGISPDLWVGINPICYTDQTGNIPVKNNYAVLPVNSYGSLIAEIGRLISETNYPAKVNYTVTYSDSTTYSSSVILKNGDQSTAINLPVIGKSADAVMRIGIDTVVNLSYNYGVTFQKFPNRQRLRDGYTEANTLSGGAGPYIAPVQNSSGCSLLFSNTAQTGFYKNNCSAGNGAISDYIVAAGTYTASSQFKADSIARYYGQAHVNATGNCTGADTTFAGINPSCITGTADSGTPTATSYSMNLNNTFGNSLLTATISRSAAETTHDVTVSYNVLFKDGSVAAYNTSMYKNHQTINISPPLAGYTPSDVSGFLITNVIYDGLKRRSFTDRRRYINGIADGYQEANSPGIYYLAPIEDPSACATWYYSAPQTNFYKAACSPGSAGALVSYTSPARTDSSMISQVYADALARVRAQAYVNANIACPGVPQPPVNINCTFYNSTGVGYEADFSNGSITYTRLIGSNGTTPVQVPQGIYTVNIFPTGTYLNNVTIKMGNRASVPAPRNMFSNVNISSGSADNTVSIYLH